MTVIELHFRKRQGIIKVEETKEPVKYRKLKDADLPAGFLEKFRSVVVPTYISYVAQYTDPWRVEDTDSVVALEMILAEVFGKHAAFNITPQHDIFKTVRSLSKSYTRSALKSSHHWWH